MGLDCGGGFVLVVSLMMLGELSGTKLMVAVAAAAVAAAVAVVEAAAGEEEAEK